MNPETTVNSSNTGPFSGDRNELSPLYSVSPDNKGLRGIIVCFTVFTIIMSVFLAIQLEYGDYQVVPHGSVVSDSEDCSAVGVATMKKGGNAVDALVATSFCLAVVLPHLTGLGGGGFLLIYDQRQRTLTECFDFRVTAAVNSNIGVPGFVAGLASVHKKHGILPWSTLLSPAIEIARAGFVASESLLSAKTHIRTNTSVYQWVSSWQPSSLITNLQLADTLQVLATGTDAFYRGKLSTQLEDYFTASELSNYQVLSDSCQTRLYNQYTVVVPGSGSGGPLLLQTLGSLNHTLLHEAPIFSVALAMKDKKESNWTFNMGSHTAAVDHNDLYVTAVSGLGSVFGAQEITQGGYILNNALALFPVGSDNRPISLATPVVAVHSKQVCGQRNILGGSDARDVAQVLSVLLDRSSLSNLSLTDIIDEPRVRIKEREVYLEDSHVPNIDSNERNLFSFAQYKILSDTTPYPCINIIHKVGDYLTSVSDPRGSGGAIVF